MLDKQSEPKLRHFGEILKAIDNFFSICDKLEHTLAKNNQAIWSHGLYRRKVARVPGLYGVLLFRHFYVVNDVGLKYFLISGDVNCGYKLPPRLRGQIEPV